MRIQKWFFDGHPQKYHVLALVLAMAAISLTATATLLAEENGTTAGSYPTSSTTTINTAIIEPESCSYSYSSWGACQPDGKRYRTVTNKSPSGCVEKSSPDLVDSCTYSSPTTTTTVAPSGTTATTSETVAPQCAYSYGAWGMCQSNEKQTRPVVSKSPSGCVEYTKPYVERSCTYTSTTTTTTTTAPAPDQCIYTYSDWGSCQSNNKRTRILLSRSPTSCGEYVKPLLEQSCVYQTTVTTNTNTGTNTGTSTSVTPSTTTTTTTATAQTSATQADSSGTSIPSDVTPPFSFVNVSDGIAIKGTFTIKGDVANAQGVEYYLVPVGSNTYKYIGSGSRTSTTGWSFSFRSTEFPNGEFYLRVKVKNIYGEYGSGQRKIKITNESPAESAVAAFDDSSSSGTTVATADQVNTLTTLAREFQMPESETGSSATVAEQKKKIFNYCETYPDKCFPERDTDKDGLSDIDEIRYGTDPKSADSDLDGFIDGDEVESGFDPSKYSPGDQSDRIVFEDPKVAGETKEKVYTVENVALKEVGSQKKIQLNGKGLPNSFVTIYIYSDPIVLTVKTDSDGNWTYELDKELADGEHEAYVAITDNTGKITAKSSPISFVKTAQAVTVIPAADAAATKTLSVAENRSQRDLFYLISIVIAALAVALATIGLMRHKHAAPKEEIIFTK